MKATFGIRDWSVWAPGVTSREAVRDWAETATPLPDSGERPDVGFVPAMLRRRLKRMARMQVSVARDCLGDESYRPMVFASRDGEIHRTADLLTELLQDGELSPAGFSLSVHNSASGVFSIARRDPTATTTVAAGTDTLPMAILEAAAQLDTGRSSVVVAFADEPLPVPYDAFETGDSEAVGVGLLLTRDDGAARFTLSSQALSSEPGPSGNGGARSIGARELMKCLCGASPRAAWRTETKEWWIQRDEA